ncbi:ABC transporter ATP-binding protein [Catalinimonas niigatensis]|uniref:ABC transporter ATP-binding protein n=1 Tax=Catalinimonas niigatensis TaxID=1397264 RepID=UPI0026662757|nr:ABC transporter ATP-binding protein [Catalinimonas niigatensis]WPP49427.1 ABC transporter ATP-binding protein [Catalinimonas niigatensis]
MDKEKTSSGDIIDMDVLRRIFRFVKPYKNRFYTLVFLTILVAFLSPALPFLVQKAIDQYIMDGDYQGLVYITIALVGVLILQGVVQYLHTFLSGWLGQYVIRDIRIQLYRHLLNLRLKYFDRTPIGRLVTRNVSDIETLSDIFSQGVAAIIGDMLQIVVILGVMLYIDWKLTLVSLSTLPLLIISTYVFKEKIKVAFNEVRNAVSNLNSFVQEHITGMSIVQIFGSEKLEYDRFTEINEEHKQAHLKSVMYYSVYYPVAEVIQATGIGLLVWYGARGVLHEDVTIGILVAFIMYINMFFRPIRQIADRFNTLQLGIVSSSRILKILDSDEHIPNNGTYTPDNIEGHVVFRNVWFAYNDRDYVLKDINFEVKAGDTLALVGATGAGKSSIINLLNRFYDIKRGEILVDGVEIKEYDLNLLRHHIGLVLQDVFLFSDTIEKNITLGNPNISREKVMEAAELVGAWKFIERLPGGLDYNVMERGATLSVGQRQLISFVRAMVYDPKIIVLDEATSSVDTETEELIQEAITKLMKGRTSIVIAHRLSTIQSASQIMVLDHGEIKERGTHQELLDLKGYYAQLHRLQYKEVV